MRFIRGNIGKSKTRHIGQLASCAIAASVLVGSIYPVPALAAPAETSLDTDEHDGYTEEGLVELSDEEEAAAYEEYLALPDAQPVEVTAEQLELIDSGVEVGEALATTPEEEPVPDEICSADPADPSGETEICFKQLPSEADSMPQVYSNMQSRAASNTADVCKAPAGYNVNQVQLSRNEICMSDAFQIIRGKGTAITGLGQFRIFYTFWTDSTTKDMQVRFTLKTERWEGNFGTGGAPFYLTTTPNCTNCTTTANYPISNVKLEANSVIYGARYFKGNIPSRAAVNVTAGYSYQVMGAGLVAEQGEFKAQRARCDDGVYGSTLLNAVGCVIPTAITQHVVTNTPARSEYVNHLRQAASSGLPGFTPATALTRTKDPAILNANTRTACKNVPWTRPSSDYQCDEYPFRSVREGAASAPTPRTFPGCNMGDPQTVGPKGFSRCYISGTHNGSGGGLLSSFYAANRIADGDRFWVYLW